MNHKRSLFTKLLLGIFAILMMLSSSACLFSKNMDQSLVPDAASQFMDNKGQVIYTTASAERRLPISFDKIPKNVQHAFIAIEDNRFYEHGGIDYRGTLRALITNLTGGEVQGGSTITQQLAKNAFLTQERTITRKIKEAFLAKQLENKYTKDEILDMYLNRIYFGQGAYGIESAALYYFNKHAEKLDLAEAAVLASIPKSPNYYNPFENPKANKERREIVLDQMVKFGYITQAECDKAKAENIVFNKHKDNKKDLRSYFFDYVSQRVIEEFGADALYKGGLKVYTTLDGEMQSEAESSLKYLPTHYTDGSKLTQPQVAIVAIDPTTGEIKAMIGGRGEDKFNRAALATRQPGSSFKAFVYLTAMDNGLTAATVVDDKRVVFGTWEPQNYGKNYHGKVTLRTALKNSYNIPAVLVAKKIGTEKIVAMAKALGISTLVDSGKYTDNNPAMALGGLSKGVIPLEMAAAYGTIANNGQYNTPVAITKIVNREGKVIYEHKASPKQVVSAKAAYQLTDMLKDVLVSGTGAGAGLGRPAAGKTGTTDDYRDAWFVGYTPNLACAVWVGDDNNKSMGIMTGSMAPLSIWHNFMVQAVAHLPAVDFKRPSGAVTPVGPELTNGAIGDDTPSPADTKKDKDVKDTKDKDNTTKKPAEVNNGQLAAPPKVKKPTPAPAPAPKAPPAAQKAPVVSNKPTPQK
jgi:penicillin-binding protein 1A